MAKALRKLSLFAMGALAFFSLPSARAASEIYAESAAVSLQQTVFSQIWWRWDLLSNKFHTPYFKIGGELPDSVAYFAPGWRIFSDHFGLLVEARVPRISQQPSSSGADFRTIGYYSDFREWPWSGLGTRFFLEPYSELVVSSADEWNSILTGYLRVGTRFDLTSRFTLDLFLEPYASFDRLGRFYNNRADLKANLRLNWQNAPLIFRLTASVMRYEIQDHYAGWGCRLLFVTGGVW